MNRDISRDFHRSFDPLRATYVAGTSALVYQRREVSVSVAPGGIEIRWFVYRDSLSRAICTMRSLSKFDM